MQKIKVLHFTIANAGGGITKFVLRLWKFIDREKFAFDFVTMNPYLDFEGQLEKEGCKIYHLSVYAEDNKEQFTKEVGEILDNGYDVVHLHTHCWRGFALEEIARRKGIKKIIIHAHSADMEPRMNQSEDVGRKLHFEQRKLLTEDMATDFLTCSPEAAEWLYGDKIAKEKIKIIPNAIEAEDYKYNQQVREEYREMLGFKDDDYVIGHVGRFVYQKNHEFLIRAFERAAGRNSHAKLLLIGVGELQETIKGMLEQKGLSDRVLFLNKRDDVAALMQAMDVFALPSRFEGFPIVLVEAQTAGLKCVVSNRITESAGITDNVEFLPLDEDLWADEILKYSRGYQREDMSETIERAGYGMKSLAEEMEGIYGAVLKNNAGGVKLYKFALPRRMGACA